MAAGDDHTVAIRNDGTMWGWGNNADGQIGDGTTVNRKVPTAVGTATTWSSVSAGGSGFTVATQIDASIWVWGGGFLGDGTSTGHLTPFRLGSDWDAVSENFVHALGIKRDGTLWGWGYNADGQLGDGTTTSRSAPVQIGTAANWSSVGSGLPALGGHPQGRHVVGLG